MGDAWGQYAMMIDFTGQQIGNYRLLRRLGVGGFASVYEGQHVRIATQHAAIKILHLSDINVQKFQQEAETTAALVHPNIIRLFDFDIADDPPFHETLFLVLDYAPGGSLRTRHPQGTQIPLATALEYVKVLAGALQFAHDKNVVHRDIKPDNILIGTQGELRLSDFGIAMLSQTGLTTLGPAYGVAGGTPFYMAPEQCKGRPEKASDQYALAIMAYEWLCGSPPFAVGNAISIQFQHVSEPVPLLREKLPTLPEAVEQVILTALAKEPDQRYASVRAFAQALEHAFVSSQTGQVGMQTSQTQPVQMEVQTPQTQPVQMGMQTSQIQPVQMGVQTSQTQTVPVRGQMSQPLGTRLFQYTGHSRAVHSAAWSPDGKRIASASTDKTVQVWNADGSGRPFIYNGHSEKVYAVAWEPSGKRIASASADETVQVWHTSGRGGSFTYEGHSSIVYTVAWSPDGQRIASASADKTVQVWNADGSGQPFAYEGHTDRVMSVAWSPDGQRIASASADETVQVWNADGSGQPFTYEGHSSIVYAVAWSPDGQRIASAASLNFASNDKTVHVWNADGSGQPLTYKGHSEVIRSVAWSPDGQCIAYATVTASNDNTVHIWHVNSGGSPLTYKGHSSSVYAVAWSPDGQRMASAGQDKTVQVWSAG